MSPNALDSADAYFKFVNDVMGALAIGLAFGSYSTPYPWAAAGVGAAYLFWLHRVRLPDYIAGYLFHKQGSSLRDRQEVEEYRRAMLSFTVQWRKGKPMLFGALVLLLVVIEQAWTNRALLFGQLA